MENRPAEHDIYMRVGRDTSVNEGLEFPAFGVSVDNNTSQWVYVNDANRFVAPNTSRQFALYAARSGKATFQAPPGKTQAAIVAGEECILVFTSEPLPTTGAQVPSVLSTATNSGMQVISDQTLSVAAATIDILNITQTFKNLLLLLSGAGTDPGTFVDVAMRFNGDVGANYDRQGTQATGVVAPISTEAQAATSIRIGHFVSLGGPANARDQITVDIQNYADTTFQKTSFSEGTLKTGIIQGSLTVYSDAGWWRSLAAINRITLFPVPVNFAVGTRATLYGLP